MKKEKRQIVVKPLREGVKKDINYLNDMNTTQVLTMSSILDVEKTYN